MAKTNPEKECSYCKQELIKSCVLIADVNIVDNDLQLSEDPHCQNEYCDLFCLMKDLVANIETSRGQTLN